MGSARRGRAGPLKERGSGPKLAFLHVRGPRTQLCSRRNVSGGPRLPGASLRSFPSPLSREPDLASAIFPSPSSLRFCFQHVSFTSLVFFFHRCVAVLSDFPFFGDVFIPFRGGFSVLSLGLKCSAHLAKGFLPSPRRNGAIAFSSHPGAGWGRGGGAPRALLEQAENVVQPRPGRVAEGTFAAKRPFYFS